MLTASIGNLPYLDVPPIPSWLWPDSGGDPRSIVGSFFQFQKRQPGGRPRFYQLILPHFGQVDPPPGIGFEKCHEDDGLAMIDGPNLLCAIYELAKEYYPSAKFFGLDLFVLRQCLERLGLDDFLFVHRFDAQRSRFNMERQIRLSGWRYLEVTNSHFGLDLKDPVDDHIRGRIRQSIGRRSTLSLTSHDGGYAVDIEEYLKAGGHFVLCGFLGRISRRLYELSDRYDANQFKIIDLQYDAKTVEFPGRGEPKGILNLVPDHR